MSDLHAITYDDAVAVTPADSGTDAAGPFAGLLVTAAGTLKVTTKQGTTFALAALPVGFYLNVPVKLVWLTGTTATVVGLTGGICRPGAS